MSLFEDKYHALKEYWSNKILKASDLNPVEANSFIHDMLQDFIEEVDEFNSKLKDDLQQLNEEHENLKDIVKGFYVEINSTGILDE